MASSSNSAAATANMHHQQAAGQGGIPAPPPPTPSNQTLSKSLSTDADTALSLFLHQLHLTPTPSLSPPPLFSRPSKKTPPQSPPIISLLEPQQHLLLSATSDLGFFHLTDHCIPSHLPTSALLQSQSLRNSAPIKNLSSLGFNHDDDDDDDDDDDEDEDEDGDDPFRVFDTASGDLDAFPAMKEYARSLERVGVEVVEMILSTGGYENPFRIGTTKPRCLMWVSTTSSKEEGQMKRGKCYPYVVCLEYEMKWWRKPCWVVGELGGWIAVDPCVDSVLVTLGDIAQVWSNGRFKKLRGRPQPSSLPLDDGTDNGSISVSLMVTLPLDCVVSPLLPLALADFDERTANGSVDDDEDGRKRFRAFSLEDYAWRVLHERLSFKDPLLRYRI